MKIKIREADYSLSFKLVKNNYSASSFKTIKYLAELV